MRQMADPGQQGVVFFRGHGQGRTSENLPEVTNPANGSRWRLGCRGDQAEGLLEKIGPGQMISDLVATIGSLDIVLGEIDR